MGVLGLVSYEMYINYEERESINQLSSLFFVKTCCFKWLCCFAVSSVDVMKVDNPLSKLETSISVPEYSVNKHNVN